MKTKIVFTDIGKLCTRCSSDLPLTEYYKERSKLGLKAECKRCWAARTRAHFDANKERKYALDKAWRKAEPGKYAAINRRSQLKRKYGISLAEYEAMLAAQGGRCAGCGSTDNGDPRFDTFSVDHDHDTAKVRGLLCSHCNKALGHVKDNPDVLIALAAYLLQYTDVLKEIGASA